LDGRIEQVGEEILAPPLAPLRALLSPIRLCLRLSLCAFSIRLLSRLFLLLTPALVFLTPALLIIIPDKRAGESSANMKMTHGRWHEVERRALHASERWVVAQRYSRDAILNALTVKRQPAIEEFATIVRQDQPNNSSVPWNWNSVRQQGPGIS
jgi:hypothetical protein